MAKLKASSGKATQNFKTSINASYSSQLFSEIVFTLPWGQKHIILVFEMKFFTFLQLFE